MLATNMSEARVRGTDEKYQRMLAKFSFIRTGKPDAIALHFNGPQHSMRDMAVIGIDKIKTIPIAERRHYG